MNLKKKQRRINLKSAQEFALACVAGGSIWWNANNICLGQTPPPNLSPEVQEVVKLSQAQMTDDIIVAFIKNSGKSFSLSADDILYLKTMRVSEPVISVLLQNKAATPASLTTPEPVPATQPTPPITAQQQPGPPPAGTPQAPPMTAPPAQEVNFNYFHDQLAPFGTWIDVGGVLYWRPDRALQANPDWRPYYDMGRWTQTDNGLFWQSDYQWGDIPFHYGRWVRDPRLGWLWAPDYTWGPSWVFWRHGEADAAIGWAPLPVGAVYVDGGFLYHGARVGVDFDFGLGEGVFVFVGYDHFHEGFFRMRGREYAWHVHGDRFHEYYRRSVIRNEFRRDEHGRFVNEGIGHARMEAATHGRVERAKFEERKPVGDREHANASRSQPQAAKSTASATPASKVYRPPASTPAPAQTPKTTPPPAQKPVQSGAQKQPQKK